MLQRAGRRKAREERRSSPAPGLFTPLCRWLALNLSLPWVLQLSPEPRQGWCISLPQGHGDSVLSLLSGLSRLSLPSHCSVLVTTQKGPAFGRCWVDSPSRVTCGCGCGWVALRPGPSLSLLCSVTAGRGPAGMLATGTCLCSRHSQVRSERTQLTTGAGMGSTGADGIFLNLPELDPCSLLCGLGLWDPRGRFARDGVVLGPSPTHSGPFLVRAECERGGREPWHAWSLLSM